MRKRVAITSRKYDRDSVQFGRCAFLREEATQWHMTFDSLDVVSWRCPSSIPSDDANRGAVRKRTKRTLAARHNQLNQRFGCGVDRHPDCQNRRSS